MKTILLAIAACLVLGIGAAAILGSSQKLAYEAYSTSGARVTPTDNLVGSRWTGDRHITAGGDTKSGKPAGTGG